MFNAIRKTIAASVLIATAIYGAHHAHGAVVPKDHRVTIRPGSERPDFRQSVAFLQNGPTVYMKEFERDFHTVAAAPFNAYSISTLGGNCATWGAFNYQSSNGQTKCLAPVNGDVMVSHGSGADPTMGTPSGVGTVTSIGVTVPADESVSPATITAAGTFAFSRNSQAANLFLASPNGSAGVPSYRGIVPADFGSQTANLVLASPNGSAGVPTFRGIVNADIGTNQLSNARLAQTGAATLKGNPTVATANVQDFTIGSLTPDTAPNVTSDLILIFNAASGTFESISPSQLATGIGAGVPSVFGRTGAIVAVANDYALTQVAPNGGGSPTASGVGQLLDENCDGGIETLTFTSGQANIASSGGNTPPLGCAVHWGSGSPTGFSNNTNYYVVALAGNNIQLSATPTGAAITPTSSTALTAGTSAIDVTATPEVVGSIILPPGDWDCRAVTYHQLATSTVSNGAGAWLGSAPAFPTFPPLPLNNSIANSTDGAAVGPLTFSIGVGMAQNNGTSPGRMYMGTQNNFTTAAMFSYGHMQCRRAG